MSDPLAISHQTRADQHAAASPANNAWVRANAGSGKTFVLTRRVLRLLLAGTPPDEILCLTYTKAAAAEMRTRVAEILAGWTMMAENELIAELSDLEGAPPDEKKLTTARALFVSALETPGGLKINTIHAFCEKVLRRFPLEAGVPFN
ncbi:MAG: UvrD-helicase domain-containing protein, partial [Alphaproteobacteria bacterium]|nr:UvrD-helicase domain-containing protein [Alphaproteobacteria bacterium]